MITDTSEDFLPLGGIDVGEEGVCRFHDRMDARHVHPVGPPDHLAVHHAAADDKDLAGSGGRGEGIVGRGKEFRAGGPVGFGHRLV